MNYLFGLGNPGENYRHTRHNAGWLFVDFWAGRHHLTLTEKKSLQAEMVKTGTLVIAKPLTFMNESGRAVQLVTHFFGTDSKTKVLVAFDDLDLELGRWKISERPPKTHNGLASIAEQVSSSLQIIFLRIGVDTRQGDRTMPPANFVMLQLTKAELAQLQHVFEEVMAENLF